MCVYVDFHTVSPLQDTNNNQPQFTSCSYAPEVQENRDVGTFVVQVGILNH